MRIRRLSKRALALVGVLSLAAQAEDGVRVSLGATYRRFGNVDFRGLTLRNYGVTDKANGPLGLQGYTDATFPAAYAGTPSVDHAAVQGDTEAPDSASCYGTVVSAEKNVYGSDSLVLRLVANLQYFKVDAGRTDTGSGATPGRFTMYTNRHNVLAGLIQAPWARLPAASAGTTVSVRNDLVADLYVLDLGLKAVCCPDAALTFYAAAGPTLTIVDVETFQRESAAWAAVPLTNDTGSYRLSHRDDDTDVVLGAYAAAGAEYRFGERLAVAAEFRYDATAGDPGTDHADMDLDGAGGQVKLTCDF